MAQSSLVLIACLCVSIVAVNSYLEKTVYVNVGRTFTLPCKNDTPGDFLGIVWKSKVELYTCIADAHPSFHNSIASRSRLVNETFLQIDKAKQTDSGIYDCNLLFVSPTLGFPQAMVASRIKLVVFAQPEITSLSPIVQYRRLDKEAVMNCSVRGYPYANITWRHDGGNDLSKKITTRGNTSVLKVKWLKRSDSGNYTCIAYNRAGRVEKKSFLKVQYPPKITSLPPYTRINVDASGKITCKATGYPVPSIYWQLHMTSETIDLSSGQSYGNKFKVSKTKKNLNEESATNHLFINSVEVNDWKINFTCIATGIMGTITEKAKIDGFDKPGTPRILEVLAYTDNVIVRWSVPKDGGSKLLAYVIEYKNATEKEWKSREIRPANVDRFQIMDLQPSVIYNFRLYAKNAVGRSTVSKEFFANTISATMNNKSPGTAKPSKKDSTVSKEKDGIFGKFGITAMIGVFAGVFLVLVIIFVVVFFLFRKVQKTANSHTASIPGSRPVSMENGSLLPPDSRRPSTRPSETTEFIPLLPRADHWEFPRDRLRLSTVLGSGAFGMVMRGDAQGIRGSIGIVKVAVKIAKDTDNEHARKDLCAELDMLKLLPEHENVVGFLGCCSRSEPLMIIVEYCAHGDLQGFLRSSRGISEKYYKTTYHPTELKTSSKMLLTFAWQIAKGMSHLSAFKVIHRDLASRNILVDENLVCKISDFGFARDIYTEDQYMKKSQGGRFPIKWMALESLLDGISTSKSDVWSFGVVLWEIVTLGASPYPGMNSYEVISFLQDGYRMEKPKHCSDEVYAVSMDCWHIAAQRRPAFEDLAGRLKQMVDDDKEYINMNFYQDHLYENFDVNLGCQTSANTSAMELGTSEMTPLAGAASC